MIKGGNESIPTSKDILNGKTTKDLWYQAPMLWDVPNQNDQIEKESNFKICSNFLPTKVLIDAAKDTFVVKFPLNLDYYQA